MDEDFELEMSPLCQELSNGGRTLQVEIYGDGEGKWILEVVDELNNSTVWDDHFESAAAALVEAKRTILAEGVESLIGPKSGKGDAAP